METRYFDGRAVATQMREQLATTIRQQVLQRTTPPGLAVILVGDDPASDIYVRQKRKAAEAVGMQSWEYRLNASVTTDEVVDLVKTLNHQPNVHGILVQLPLPNHIGREPVIEAIDPLKDVDGLTRVNQGALMKNQPGLRPCTPSGIIALLKHYGVNLEGRRAAVIGRSTLVGLPISLMLMQQQATVTMIHSHTQNPKELCRTADLVIVAAGRPRLVTREWIRPGAIVVDVGIHRLPEGLCGDVAADEMDGYAGALTPVPGGVGPMTIAALLQNTWQAYASQVAQ
ncbi:MAG: bifunctional methylenetetrahydrofolate dehydrogenase/methenyltetrahydrofolate cyclohydrolase FolD [Firmicutes bacterium]|nr:bifunctional methylenetetrahydrofolate dehydrogenase/methenyltetrahydrofolate cyclohydrolase FolD [Bacillota bacterium]